MQVSETLTSTPSTELGSDQTKRHRKIKIPRNQAKVVSDEEMQSLLIEAASKCFYSHLTQGPFNTSTVKSSDLS